MRREIVGPTLAFILLSVAPTIHAKEPVNDVVNGLKTRLSPVGQGVAPDLALTNLTACKDLAGNLQVAGQVENQGSGISDPTTTEIKYNGNDLEPSQPVKSLQKGEPHIFNVVFPQQGNVIVFEIDGISDLVGSVDAEVIPTDPRDNDFNNHANARVKQCLGQNMPFRVLLPLILSGR